MAIGLTGPVLITGGTGMQGRPTVAATLAKGIKVRALVRDPSSAHSRGLAELGAELVRGTFEDADSLDRAMAGVRGVFSLQNAHPVEGKLQQEALIAAAQRAGVEQFIQSTVSSAGLHESFVDWDKGRWLRWYWLEKAAEEERIRGFKYWTAVRPALLMDNFCAYRAQFMHPKLITDGEICVATRPDVDVAYVSSNTVGAATAAAFAEPERFHGVAMELADEMITTARIGQILSEVTGHQATITYVPYAELVARGHFEGMVSAEDWLNVEGYAARPAMLADYGLTPVSFRAWAIEHASEITVGTPKAA